MQPKNVLYKIFQIYYDFICRAVVHRSPPQIPSHLLRKLELTADSVGKIRVILRVAKGASLAVSPDGDVQGNQIFQMDRRRKQLTMYDPSGMTISYTVAENLVKIKIE